MMSTALATTVRAVQGDTLCALVHRHLGVSDRGVLEQVLAANPGLANQGPILDMHTPVELPRIQRLSTPQPLRLWD